MSQKFCLILVYYNKFCINFKHFNCFWLILKGIFGIYPFVTDSRKLIAFPNYFKLYTFCNTIILNILWKRSLIDWFFIPMAMLFNLRLKNNACEHTFKTSVVRRVIRIMIWPPMPWIFLELHIPGEIVLLWFSVARFCLQRLFNGNWNIT